MRRREGNNIYVILLCIVFVLAGCSSGKQATHHSVADIHTLKIVAESPSVTASRGCLSANVRLSLNAGGKSFSSSGSLRIKKGEGIQIGVTALGLMEIACLEFLPAGVRVINKIGKEYADVPYADVSFLQRTGIDYTLLESVFMNRIFSPDGKPFPEALDGMVMSADDDSLTVTTKEHNGLVYKFVYEKSTSNLISSEGQYRNGVRVVCSYEEFEELDGVPFPRVILLSLEGAGKNVRLQLKLSSFSSGAFDFSPRKISSGYKKIEGPDLLKFLENL